MDLDDPLGDILSDDSNDSFFNDDKYIKKTPISNVGAKKLDLFGIESGPKSTESLNIGKDKSNDDWLGLDVNEGKNILQSDTKKVETKFVPSVPSQKPLDNDVKSTLSVQKINKPTVQGNQSDPLEFLGDLKLISSGNVRKPERNTKETLDLDELLGPRNQSDISNKPALTNEKKSVSLANYTPTFSNAPKREILNSEPEPKPRLKTAIKEVIEKPKQINEPKILSNPNKPESKENLISNRRQKVSNDWLGLLSDTNDNFIESNLDKTESLSNLLAKSGIEEKPLPLKEENVPVTEKPIANNTVSYKQSDVISATEKYSVEMDNRFGKIALPDLMNNPALSMASNIDIEQQSAAICLQQQESHLMVALQMKAQEEKLAAMRERQMETHKVQKEVVTAHREQLNDILKRQADHRSQLQNIIGEHQLRINKHIELLLKAPETNINNDENMQNYKDSSNSFYEKTTIGKNNEKGQLEETINNIRESYEKEIELIESSYKRQISILNELLISIEERNKIEMEKNSNYLLGHIEKLEIDKIKITEYFENHIKLTREKQKDEIESIEKKHMENIEILQKQHHLVISNIRDSIQLEKATIKETTDYSQQLNHIVNDIEQNNKMCSNVMEKLEKVSNVHESEKLELLKTKEEYLNRMLSNLEKQTIVYENESKDTKSLLIAFEQRLNQQKLLIDDERQRIKQKEIELSNERDVMRIEYEQLKKKLEHEKEIFRKASAEFETMNANSKADIEEKLKKIELEKLSLKNENKALDESKAEIQIIKLKLENDMKELNEKKKSIQTEQDKLYESEMKILERSKDLEALTRNALAKQKYAESKFVETSYAQRRYEEKLAKIQEQSLSLNAREQQLAKEKVALSRERLLLYNQRSENEYAICGTCRASNIPQRLVDNEHSDMTKLYSEYVDTTHFPSFSMNNNISRLRWLENKLDNKDLKEIKDDLNNLDRQSNNHERTNGAVNKDDNVNVPAKFQEMVDPKLMALKFDLFERNKYL